MSTSKRSSQVELLDGTGLVGWVESNRLTFAGFGDPAEAAAAAWIAHVALERRLAESRQEPAPYTERPPLFLVRSGEHEWIEGDEKRLARLLRPGTPGDDARSSERAESSDWYGLEIALPPDASELTTRSSAHVIYRALRRSGLRWSVRADRLAMDATAAVTRAADSGNTQQVLAAPLARIPTLEVAHAVA